MYSRSRESSAGTICGSKGALDGERPERRSCFSTWDFIRLVSCPFSETSTITASRWSIHKPASVFIFICVSVCGLAFGKQGGASARSEKATWTLRCRRREPSQRDDANQGDDYETVHRTTFYFYLFAVLVTRPSAWRAGSLTGQFQRVARPRPAGGVGSPLRFWPRC